MWINWKSYLDYHYPYISKVYLDDSDMDAVNLRIQKRNDTLNVEGHQYETTFYDLLVRVIHPEIGTSREKEVSLKILDFLNEQINAFMKLVGNNSELIKQLKKQLDNLFRVNGDKYLDKFGEIASTVFLMQKFGAENLNSLEYKFEKEIRGKNSRDVDLVFSDKISKELILIEVFNVKLDYKRIMNEEGLLKILNDKLSKKRKEKGLDSDFLTGKYKYRLLQPFIWIFDIDTIFKYNDFLRTLNIENILPILCLRQRSDNEGRIYYDCTDMINLKK